MLNRITLGLATVLLITTPHVAALSFDEKQAREQPLLNCIASIKTVVSAVQQSGTKLESESNEDVYGKNLDLWAKYIVALFSTVYDNSERNHTIVETTDYLEARNVETIRSFAKLELKDKVATYQNCYENQQSITEEGLMLTEEIFGYGASSTMRNTSRKELEKLLFNGTF